MAAKRLNKSVKKAETQELIPNKEYAEAYIGRTIEGKTDFEVFDYGRASHTNILIEGPTGPGKTSAVLAYAAERGLPFYAIPSNVGIEPSQLFGKFIPDEVNGGFVWVDGPVTSIVRHGGVLLINEVNFMPERVATVLFGLLDKRRQIVLLDHKGEVVQAADDLLIIADMNPDYEGTRPLNKAFRNRFGIQLWWGYDPEVEKQLVNSPRLASMANDIRRDGDSGVYSTPVSTNMLIEFEQIAFDLGIEFAIVNFVNHFAREERQSIKLVCDTHKGDIWADLETVLEGGMASSGMESEYPEDHPIWDEREKAENGWNDPEWGIKGVDWVYDD